ncbi:hypothetical protein PNI02_11190 [Pseudoalteromonas nigrifaciens]|nr:hypothetical protein PNI02_11190 [Pseudoalteromonas nigrifaciens]SUC50733.1 Linear gramicidin dehydrogenase LgrE [Pseudoalteromonas nigrifaciens]
MESSNWFIFPQLRFNLKLRLFCLHFVEGDTSIYTNWREHFPECEKIIGVQSSGRATRIAEMHYLADALLPDIIQILDCP